jgi:acyl-[acyl carrier protein]--UDP-N-acetylglucosamine O-acyltransferase
VNPNVYIGHDTAVGDHVTLTPQVAVAGNVKIREQVSSGQAHGSCLECQ